MTKENEQTMKQRKKKGSGTNNHKTSNEIIINTYLSIITVGASG